MQHESRNTLKRFGMAMASGTDDLCLSQNLAGREMQGEGVRCRDQTITDGMRTTGPQFVAFPGGARLECCVIPTTRTGWQPCVSPPP